MKRYSIISVVLIWCGLSGLISHAAAAERGVGGGSRFTITCAAFGYGQQIPTKYTADGADISPPLKWAGVPDGVKSFVLICEDPDSPAGIWVHWVVYGIPPEMRELPENISDQKEVGIKQGLNDFRRLGYGGPAPPHGKPHRYFFRLYALDRSLEIGSGATKKELMKAVSGHVTAEAEWMGTYQR